MLSSEVNFTLDYTPKFIKDPLVMERKASPLSNVRVKSPIQKRDIYKVVLADHESFGPHFRFRELPPLRGRPPNPSWLFRLSGTCPTSTSPSVWTGWSLNTSIWSGKRLPSLKYLTILKEECLLLSATSSFHAMMSLFSWPRHTESMVSGETVETESSLWC